MSKRTFPASSSSSSAALAEADSTTGLADPDAEDSAGAKKHATGSSLYAHPFPEPSEGLYKRVVKDMLAVGHEGELLEWMKECNLLCATVRCANTAQVGCASGSMVWTPTRVVDKFQWQCAECHSRMHIRDNSFFKHIFCSLPVALKIILAWCQDLDYGDVADALDVKRHIVGTVYDKLERLIFTSPNPKLGGPGDVTLIDMFPDMIGETHPDSSKSDSTTKSQCKILCIADTKRVPTRYWLHVVNGSVYIPTENNNDAKYKKVDLASEAKHVIRKTVPSGGYCVVGGGSYMDKLYESLKSDGPFVDVVRSSSLVSECDRDLREFFTRTIWKSALKLCEAAQDLPKNKMQPYLSGSLWRRENENNDVFQSMIRLIADRDHSNVVQKKK